MLVKVLQSEHSHFAMVFQHVNDWFMEFQNSQAFSWLFDDQVWMNLGLMLLKIVVIWIGGRMLARIVVRAIQQAVERQARHSKASKIRRSRTIGKLAINTTSSVINFMIILLILSQLQFDLLPLLAGAGIIGLAIGFGAQHVVRDVITGFLIIFEDQFGVGDVVAIGKFKGTVEEIGLRVTKIRSWTGEVHIVPNGAISDVTNYSKNNSICVVDVSVAYEADLDKAMAIIKETVRQVYTTNENMVKEPDVLGVEKLGASEVIIRITGECKPMTHAAVGRQLNAELKKALEAKGIEIPYPRLVTIQRTESM